MAIELYRRANEHVLQHRLPEALVLYEEAALLCPDYADADFPIGQTVQVQMARRLAGEHLSCRWLEDGLHFHDRLRICCTPHRGGKGWVSVGTYRGGPLPIDYVLARRHQLVSENQEGVDNPCSGCHELQRRSWPSKGWPFGSLIINSYTVCNMHCDYCSLAKANFEMPAYYYMLGPAIESLVANDWLAPEAFIIWGGGEPGLCTEFPNIAKLLLTTGRHFDIYTNAGRLMPEVLDGLRKGRCNLIISLDSGTPETFYRIKFQSERPVQAQGRPVFETVWENIARYTEASRDSVVIKYIFTPDNCTDADVTGFVTLCLSHGVGTVMLTLEASYASPADVPPALWLAIEKARALAAASGLLVHCNPLDPKYGNGIFPNLFVE
jgi:hypothetical protein